MKNFNVSMKQLFVLLLFLCAQNIAQVPYAVAPLALSNYWVYEEYDNSFPHNLLRTTIIKVVGTLDIDSIKYYEISISGIVSNWPFRFRRLRDDGYYVMKNDSTFPMPNNEEIFYKKDALYGDAWQNLYTSQTHYYTIIDTAWQNVFGYEIKIKLLNITNQSLLDYDQIWCEEFGLLASEDDGVFNYLLKGCIIDGVLYGDTTVTNVEEEKDIIYSFSLSQNYPNPFNSSTIIEYEIYSQSYVKLMVYNSLGESVSNLISGMQQRGKYKIEFIAENLPSGIYFYRLSEGRKSIIKKMVLLN